MGTICSMQPQHTSHHSNSGIDASLTSPAAIQHARQVLHPTNFGLQLHPALANPADERAWVKTLPEIGRVCFTKLSWEHGDRLIPWHEADGTLVELSFLQIAAWLQVAIWGIDDKDVLPPIVMSIVESTGGYLGVAYLEEKGFTANGWLGFALGFGASNGVLVSHMLGTKPEIRSSGIGQHLKLLQGYEALKTGHHTLEWTFDPIRSSNAWFNFSKFGVFADHYIVNKYGDFVSDLYGTAPSDRFMVRWQVTSPTIQAHVQQAFQGDIPSRSLTDIQDIVTATPDTIETILQECPRQVKYEIPGDIDELLKTDPPLANQWRQQARDICTRLMNAELPSHGKGNPLDPATISVKYTNGPYIVSDVVTGIENKTRHTFYIFTRKD